MVRGATALFCLFQDFFFSIRITGASFDFHRFREIFLEILKLLLTYRSHIRNSEASAGNARLRAVRHWYWSPSGVISISNGMIVTKSL